MAILNSIELGRNTCDQKVRTCSLLGREVCGSLLMERFMVYELFALQRKSHGCPTRINQVNLISQLLKVIVHWLTSNQLKSRGIIDWIWNIE